MNTTHAKATYYFQSYHDYFWEWEVDHMFQGSYNCISIPQGMTIVYKEPVVEVLQLLSETGLPPFGALVLVFLATNSGEVDSAIKEIFAETLEKHTNFPTVGHIDFAAAESFLKTLRILPEAYKKGQKRVDLLVFLFEMANHSLSPKYSDEILDFIQNQSDELHVCSVKQEITVATLSKDINALALLHKRYPTVEALVQAWLKIEEVPVDPEDAEIEHISQNPDIIQQLIEDPKTFFMGSLVKRLWSGIQLPMHYSHPGEMPLGGISDITNKGKFDNILMSEFANDDLIFLHRIANKEALFIRRETTPEEDLRTRIFLIDTTIKNWGTPKILSFATAFSFIHHPKNNMYFQPYALGETYQQLHFDTKENVSTGLQLASPKLDAAEAIEKFIDECEEENIEITLFTVAKTLTHHNIRRIFNLHHKKFGGVITSDSQGNIDVYKLKNGTRSLSKHIQLPLAELWAHPPKRKTSDKEVYTMAKDVINYPLLYGFPTRIGINFTDEHSAYLLQKNGDLFRTEDRNKGFQMVDCGFRFVTGISQQKFGVMFQGELLILYWNANNHMVFKTQHHTYSYKFDLSKYKNKVFTHLIVHEEEVYLVTKNYYSSPPVFTYFDIYEQRYTPIENPSKALEASYKAYLKNEVRYFEGSVFTKIKSITFTDDLELVFNFKHRLDIVTSIGYFDLLDEEEEMYLEDQATVYFRHRNQKVSLGGGSEIEIDKNGILIFRSGNPDIPTFYVASYIGINIALATDEEFAGADYFLPSNSMLRKIEIHEFDIKYVEPFISHILDTWS
ncbi:hypothetical protein C8N46_102279 [Kordia periserrulae]|uniref:Uncharacterized protein n=1 Tax=Kordia periserrulae TaxID=701523 RepID=A0A2T6C3I3_9FLAO|nr:hypothetical protein [Kordia periserrulae]PTX62879.1 hypothetical protein C8N46_102279 [Kordia periserrulae]